MPAVLELVSVSCGASVIGSRDDGLSSFEGDPKVFSNLNTYLNGTFEGCRTGED